MSQGLLFSPVPHSSDQREPRRDGCFSSAEKEASNDKTLEVLNCSVTDQDDSPDKAASQVRFCSLHRGLGLLTLYQLSIYPVASGPSRMKLGS